MASAKLKAAPDADESAEVGKKKSKKMLIIIGAVGVLAAAAAAYFLVFAGGGSAEAKEPDPGVVVPLEAITINLEEGHYLKLGLALQATAAVAEAPDGSKALDLAISEFSNRSVAELSTDKAREAAKEELLKKVEKAYEDEIMDIYFTSFVKQ